MKEILIKEYNNLQKILVEPSQPSNTFHVDFVNGAKVEILGKVSKKYKVQ